MRARAVAKEIVYGLAHLGGLAHLKRKSRRGGLSILTYHSFGPAAEHPYLNRMPVQRMDEQIRHLKTIYDLVDIETGLARLTSGDADASALPMVAITVDDGYGDNYEHLFPLLRAHAVPATIFLATDYIDSGHLPWPTRLSAALHYATASKLAGPDEMGLDGPSERSAAGRRLRQSLSRLGTAERKSRLEEIEAVLKPRRYTPLKPLTWESVRNMRAAGIRFGAHTHWHGWLDRLPESDRNEELVTAKRRIEAELQEACAGIAYPNGNWNDDVAEAAQRAGYRWAVTQDAGVNSGAGAGVMALRRIEVPFDERIGTFACRVSGVAA